MSDDRFRPPFAGADDEALGHDGDGLPEHESDADTTVGAGLMGSGGTITDRGTGELGGTAQGHESDDDVDGDAGVGGAIAGPPAGGAQTYVPVVVDDDEDGGALPDA